MNAKPISPVPDAKRIAFVFDMFGPYHLARLNAVGARCPTLGIEVRARSLTYAWEPSDAATAFERRTLLADGVQATPSYSDLLGHLLQVFRDFRPDAVFVPGWASRSALATLAAAKSLGVPAIVMSESTSWDNEKKPHKEWLKRQIVSQFAAGLAGGTPHAEYLEELGVAREHIRTGYDVVDNQFFAGGTARVRAESRREDLALPKRYMLASARFIAIKNLPLLIDAYALFRAAHPDAGLDFVLLGDGEDRSAVEQAIARHRLETHIHLPGFRQYAELPAYYAFADFFVHVSRVEPWGLVVNEAMASGLPVIVSKTCGCAADLVREGSNGLLVDPTDVRALAQAIATLATAAPDRLAALGRCSAELVSQFSPARFAGAALDLARTAAGTHNRSLADVPTFLTATVGRLVH